MVYTENKAGVRFSAFREMYANVERVTTGELRAVDLDRATINPYPEAQERTDRPFTLVYAPDGKGPPKMLPHLF